MAYQTVNAAIIQLEPQLTAAEAHGMATGILCVNSKALASYWLDELFGDTASENYPPILLGLFTQTQQLLAEDDYDFTLFLPDDEQPLNYRVAALRDWCQGFLFGVGTANLVAGYSEDTREILKDVVEITKLDNDDAADAEENEQAFMEITEYLKAAVLLLRDNFASQPSPKIH